MRTGTPSLVTLTWLDRRRVWATANRNSALGASMVPVYPSLVGGQSSRPSVTHRYFTPSYVWLANVLGAIVAIVTAAGCACYALFAGVQAAKANLLAEVDRALHQPTEPAPSLMGVSSTAALHHFTLQAELDLKLAGAIFAVLGGLDVTSATIPSVPLLVKSQGAALWDVTATPLMVGRSLVVANLAAAARAPLFRTYLGEWRRLADQASNLPILPITTAKSGSALALRQRCHAAAVATTARDGQDGSKGLNPAIAGRRDAYGLYLTNPWKF